MVVRDRLTVTTRRAPGCDIVSYCCAFRGCFAVRLTRKVVCVKSRSKARRKASPTYPSTPSVSTSLRATTEAGNEK